MNNLGFWGFFLLSWGVLGLLSFLLVLVPWQLWAACAVFGGVITAVFLVDEMDELDEIETHLD